MEEAKENRISIFFVRYRMQLAVYAVVVTIVILFGVDVFQSSYNPDNVAAVYATKYEKNPFVHFEMEIFDNINTHYWEPLNEAQLAELFYSSLSNIASTTKVKLKTRDRIGVAAMFSMVFERIDSKDSQKTLAVDIGNDVLARLFPQPFNALFSEARKEQFRDDVNNISRERNLYEEIGTSDGASSEDVEKAYIEKKIALENDNSPDATIQLEKLEYFHDVLTSELSKKIYDEYKIEPTTSKKIIENETLYVNLSQISEATFLEVSDILQDLGAHPKIKGLIVDLRGNMGGEIDFVPQMLTLFVGHNQYIYDFLRKGNKEKVYTSQQVAKIDTLKNLKNIAIFTNELTQSAAELTAVAFKQLNLGKVIGKRTRGIGAIKNTYPPQGIMLTEDEKYYIYLINSLMLRDDGELIWGRGIEPDIDVSNDGWKNRLSEVFDSQGFIKAVTEVIQ